jgi:pimeloyl-ACP methyl ester carboxylesterase
VAYQVVGKGDLDLVFLFGWPTHLELMWENPSFAAFLGKLSSFSRLVLYDRLGNGLTDRGLGGYTFEDEMDDVRTVLAAVGSERAALSGPAVVRRFPETDVRTYVVGPDGREGLWFFSLDAARLEPVLVAHST